MQSFIIFLILSNYSRFFHNYFNILKLIKKKIFFIIILKLVGDINFFLIFRNLFWIVICNLKKYLRLFWSACSFFPFGPQ